MNSFNFINKLLLAWWKYRAAVFASYVTKYKGKFWWSNFTKNHEGYLVHGISLKALLNFTILLLYIKNHSKIGTSTNFVQSTLIKYIVNVTIAKHYWNWVPKRNKHFLLEKQNYCCRWNQHVMEILYFLKDFSKTFLLCSIKITWIKAYLD